MPDIKRQTAYKCTISQILNGNYVVQQGWEPNYIDSGSLKISRINILAVITTKEGNTFTIDDGTGNITIRMFSEPEKSSQYKPGDIVLIIGRPREYTNQRYIVPEIIRKIENKKWINHRKKELELQGNPEPEPVKQEHKIEEQKQEEQEEPIETTNRSKILLQAIKKLDDGKGAPIDEVIQMSKLEDAEEYIEQLLNEGEIYEIRKGRLKVLD